MLVLGHFHVLQWTLLEARYPERRARADRYSSVLRCFLSSLWKTSSYLLMGSVVNKENRSMPKVCTPKNLYHLYQRQAAFANEPPSQKHPPPCSSHRGIASLE